MQDSASGSVASFWSVCLIVFVCEQVSFFEIYGGKLFDLLNGRKKLVSREDAGKNVVIVGLKASCSCTFDA